MVSVGSTLVGESMKPSTVRIGSVVSENTCYKDSFIYIVVHGDLLVYFDVKEGQQHQGNYA